MRKSAFLLSAAVAALAFAVAPSSSFAEDTTKFTVGGGNDFFTPVKERTWGYENKDDSGSATNNQSADKSGDKSGDKGAGKDSGKDGDKGGKQGGVKIRTGITHEHDGTVTAPIGGNTKDGSTKGGWWAQATGGGKYWFYKTSV